MKVEVPEPDMEKLVADALAYFMSPDVQSRYKKIQEENKQFIDKLERMRDVPWQKLHEIYK